MKALIQNFFFAKDKKSVGSFLEKNSSEDIEKIPDPMVALSGCAVSISYSNYSSDKRDMSAAQYFT